MLNSRKTKSAPGRGWFIAIVTLLLAMGTLSGCSVINVYDEGTLVQKYYGLPIYTIDSTQAQKTLFLESRGVGIISGPTGLSIGYNRETFLSLPTSKCVAVFINTSAEAANTLRATLESAGVDVNTLCIYPAQGAFHE
ncbi:hypothetical protein H8F23_09590 [Pseudomonas sp. P155]|uniref:DUF3574 domain-containing protein n=1 Tax=Pseudomonas neuropathica TaxID=2730425 RepID=A0ABS0BLS4_9PSED|nr:hypothetical protein [Pseudomonas neuropathica]MBF6033501.1 hypothetical protein [Pseudomonas neuropathica]